MAFWLLQNVHRCDKICSWFWNLKEYHVCMYVVQLKQNQMKKHRLSTHIWMSDRTSTAAAAAAAKRACWFRCSSTDHCHGIAIFIILLSLSLSLLFYLLSSLAICTRARAFLNCPRRTWVQINFSVSQTVRIRSMNNIMGYFKLSYLNVCTLILLIENQHKRVVASRQLPMGEWAQLEKRSHRVVVLSYWIRTEMKWTTLHG